MVNSNQLLRQDGWGKLPRDLVPKSPPLKMQGIKTKLLPLIASSISWEGEGRWTEPFLGSGAVALNIAPKRAVLVATNKHVINLYRRIQEDSIAVKSVRVHLERGGRTLSDKGESYYYAVRERFNIERDSSDFIFLNRSCFSGMVRINRRGRFNVPFYRKPEQFRPAA